MRKIRKKGRPGPKLRDSWWLLAGGLFVAVLIVFLLSRGALTPRREPGTTGWLKVTKGAAPTLTGLPEPKQMLPPTRFSLTGDPDVERYAQKDARWLAVYEIGTPPVTAEVIFFLQRTDLDQVMEKLEGVTPVKTGRTFGQQTATGPGEIAFRRGRVLVRVKGAGQAADAAAEQVDRALLGTFGDSP